MLWDSEFDLEECATGAEVEVEFLIESLRANTFDALFWVETRFMWNDLMLGSDSLVVLFASCSMFVLVFIGVVGE